MITPSFGLTATERVLPKLALDFTTASLDARVTLTRALNTATCVNSSGNVAVVNADLPRFDYDPTTLACKGLLIEESRVNSIRNNTSVGAVSGSPGTTPTNWVATTTGGVFTRTIVGTGTENGIAYVDIRYQASGAGSASVQFEGGNVIAALNGQTWTFSSYTKLVGGSLTNVTVNDSIIEDNAAGAFLTGGDSSNYVPTSASLITQRRTYTRTNTNALTAFVYARTRIAFSGAGDVTLRFGLPQLELGAFATSVIQTSSGAVTRNADVATMTGTNFSSWFNASEGTFVFGGDLYQFVAGKAHFYAFANSTNYIGIRTAPSGSTQSRMEIGGGANTCVLSPATITPAGFQEAFAYKLNNCAAAVNAGTVVTDTTVDLPATTPTALNIGSNPSTAQQLNGHAAYLAYYPQRLTDAEVQAFSKQG